MRYDFMEDNHFTELKENEIMQERVNMLNNVDPYMGRYFSQKWAKKNILRMTDEEIDQMEQEIQDEQDAGSIHPEIEPAGQQAGDPEDPDAEGGDGPPNGGTENGPPEQI